MAYGIDANQFGEFASMYYIGYAGMQIPVAILFSRFAPKFVLSLSALLCGFGCLIHSYSTDITLLFFSRFIIGAASASAFLGVSELITQWFDRKNYARMIGLTFTAGLIGAVYGGIPVARLNNLFGWHQVLESLAAVCFFIAIMIAFFVKSPDGHQARTTKIDLKKGLTYIFSNPILLWVSFANMLMVGALEGFADVWGVTYLMKSLSYSKDIAAGVISMIFVGMIFGGPILAWVAERTRSTVLTTSSCGAIIACVFLVIELLIHYFSHLALMALMWFLGVLCCYQVLIFAIGVQQVEHDEFTGLTTAFLNCINMLGGVFYHRLIGSVLGWVSPVRSVDIDAYSLSDYAAAIAVIPIGAITGSVILCVLFAHYNQKLSGK